MKLNIFKQKKSINKFIIPKQKSWKTFKLLNADEHTDTYLFIEKQKQLKSIIGESDLNISKDANVILTETIIKEKLDNVAEKTIPSKRKKNNIWSIIFLIINILIVVVLAKALLKDAGDASIENLISTQGERLYLLLFAVMLFLIIYFCDALFISVLLKSSIGEFRPLLSYKTSVIGKYYEAITPLSAGGQPAQIICMAKRGVSVGVATSIPIVRVTLLNVVNVIVALLMFVFVVPRLEPINGFLDILIGLLKILAYIGIFFNTLYLVIMLVVANSKVFGRVLARSIIKFGYKLRIVKDYRSSYRKFMIQVAEFQNSIKYIKSKFWLSSSTALIMLVEIFSFATIPFIVSLALSDISFLSGIEMFQFWLQCVSLYYICYMASAFIPLPGGTGMMELSFIILFTPIIGAQFVVYGFLIWRILTYYLTILQGFTLTLCDTLCSTFKKNRN